jgi:hypothetical protein
MIGKKERHFAQLINISLEELVPQDHFYRHLERALDLSFVREFVQTTYANGGRPSIDPHEADEQAMQRGRRMLISTRFLERPERTGRIRSLAFRYVVD